MIFTKCYFSKFQLPELLPGKGIGRCEVGGEGYSRLAELLGISEEAADELENWNIKELFEGMTLLVCYMGVNDSYIANYCLEKIFQPVGKENLLISALGVKFTLLLVWDLAIAWVPLQTYFEVLSYVLGGKIGSPESR